MNKANKNNEAKYIYCISVYVYVKFKNISVYVKFKKYIKIEHKKVKFNVLNKIFVTPIITKVVFCVKI